MAPLLKRLRMGAGAFLVDNMFRSLASVGRLHPRARPERHRVSVERNIAYAETGLEAHTLDVYRPIGRGGPHPVVFYVHGGGFRILSKDTHWIMGLAFARRGYMVFNINYRLAPAHPFPAALEDATRALTWLTKNGSRFGADMNRAILAGESAGANLVTSLAVALSYRRPETWARELFDVGLRPAAVVPACGMLQVSDVERIVRRKRNLPVYIADRLLEVSDAYLAGARPDGVGGLDLADPLLVFERGDRPDRPIPPFFAGVGTRDPLLDDTRRLKAALDRMGVRCKAEYYPGELHAFHALVWRPNAIRFWRDTFEFLDECLAPSGERSVAV
jgi:acetyl esterase